MLLVIIAILAVILGGSLYIGLIEWDGNSLQEGDSFDRIATAIEIKTQVDNFVESLRQFF